MTATSGTRTLIVATSMAAMLAVVVPFAGAVAQTSSSPRSERAIRERCMPGAPDHRDCKTAEFGEFGRIDGTTYYYALYCVIPKEAVPGRCGDTSFVARYHAARGVAVFTRDSLSAMYQVLHERIEPEIGILTYRKPVLATQSARTLLQLPIAYDGTGNGNASEYFIYEGGQWQRIESEAWLNDLQARLPRGVEVLKGVWPDIRTLRAETGLYREGDGNCCPTGGVARIKLAIRANRFVIDSLDVARSR